MFTKSPAPMSRARLPALPRRSTPKGKIATLDWYDLIGLGDVKPLIRRNSPRLARDRHELLGFMLDRFPTTVRNTIAAALDLYPPTPNPVPNPRSALVERLQGVLEAGIRDPQTAIPP